MNFMSLGADASGTALADANFRITQLEQQLRCVGVWVCVWVGVGVAGCVAGWLVYVCV